MALGRETPKLELRYRAKHFITALSQNVVVHLTRSLLSRTRASSRERRPFCSGRHQCSSGRHRDISTLTGVVCLCSASLELVAE